MILIGVAKVRIVTALSAVVEGAEIPRALEAEDFTGKYNLIKLLTDSAHFD